MLVQDIVRLPRWYFRREADNLKDGLNLVDPKGNVIEVKVEMRGNQPIISDGVAAIRRRYDEYSFILIKFEHICEGALQMRIFDFLMQEVSYPEPERGSAPATADNDDGVHDPSTEGVHDGEDDPLAEGVDDDSSSETLNDAEDDRFAYNASWPYGWTVCLSAPQCTGNQVLVS